MSLVPVPPDLARDYLWREDLRQLLMKIAEAVADSPTESGRREGRMILRQIGTYQTPILAPETAA